MMFPMASNRAYWRWLVGLACGLAVIITIEAVPFWIAHAEAFERIDGTFRVHLAFFVLLAALSLLLFMAWALRRLFRRYVHPWHRLRGDVEAALHGSPQARTFTDTSR